MRSQPLNAAFVVLAVSLSVGFAAAEDIGVVPLSDHVLEEQDPAFLPLRCAALFRSQLRHADPTVYGEIKLKYLGRAEQAMILAAQLRRIPPVPAHELAFQDPRKVFQELDGMKRELQNLTRRYDALVAPHANKLSIDPVVSSDRGICNQKIQDWLGR